MKVSFENGWRVAPHCWKHYIFSPFGFDKCEAFTSISMFGFVFWFY